MRCKLQIETQRRKTKSRNRSLIFKPIPRLPSGFSYDSSVSSDFGTSSDDDDGHQSMEDNDIVTIDDETLEDVYFEIAATLPYSDDELETENDDEQRECERVPADSVCTMTATATTPPETGKVIERGT